MDTLTQYIVKKHHADLPSGQTLPLLSVGTELRCAVRTREPGLRQARTE